MSFAFNPRKGLVIVQTELHGPSGSIILRFALDTGATSTMVNTDSLTTIGYDLSLSNEQVKVTTGGNVVFASRVVVARLKALGKEYDDFPILGHALPPSASIDGLLGLDFFRVQELNIDFRNGRITLN
jgi:predicted aspartyl protease